MDVSHLILSVVIFVILNNCNKPVLILTAFKLTWLILLNIEMVKTLYIINYAYVDVGCLYLVSLFENIQLQSCTYPGNIRIETDSLLHTLDKCIFLSNWGDSILLDTLKQILVSSYTQILKLIWNNAGNESHNFNIVKLI